MSHHIPTIVHIDGQQVSLLQEFISWLNESNAKQAVVEIESIHNNPNFLLINTENTSLTIATVRELLSTISYAQSTQSTLSVVLLNAEKITTAAQNALLKVLEEPPENTAFFLVTTQKEALLDTVQSRCVIIYRTINENSSSKVNEREEILTLYNQIKQATSQKKTVIAAQYKEKDAAVMLCHNLLFTLHAQLKKNALATTEKKGGGEQHASKILVADLQHTHRALQLLEGNVNVLLTLEQLFFSF